MYDVKLQTSYFPPLGDGKLLQTTVGQLLRDVAAEHGGKEALVEVDMEGETRRRWTYGDLLSDAERLAQALASRFSKGEKVCVWAPNIPEWVLMEYACGLAGLVLVTANPAYQPKELRYVLEQSDSVALFFIDEYRGNPMRDIALQATDGLDQVRERVNLDDHDALFANAGANSGLPEVLPEDPAQIQYTSGTTGFPKGAVLHHLGLTNNARLYAERAGADGDVVWPAFMPLFHTSGCAMNVLGGLQVAGKLVLIKFFDPAIVLRLIETEKLTALLGVPTMLIALCEAQSHMNVDTSTVKIAVSGGSMVAPDVAKNVIDTFGCDFQTVYGQTETSPLITQQHLGETLEDICNTIGQPVPLIEVAIHELGTGDVASIGTAGEICVRGYCVMIGYNNNPEATAETIDESGWLHTGDLGTMDERGYVRITGRVKEMIIRGGENMFPAEIENCLLDHPDVAEVAVVGLPDPKWGEIIACFIRTENNKDLSESDLRAHCRSHLAPQKTPVVWNQVTEFPLTGSGKIRKIELRDQYLANLPQ